MRVCINKITGKFIEAQSGGKGQKDLDVLIANAVSSGYNAADIETKYIDDAEFKRLSDIQRESEMTYKEKRAREYPPFTDYIDGIVKGDAAQVQKYIDDCRAVKAKYPKV